MKRLRVWGNMIAGIVSSLVAGIILAIVCVVFRKPLWTRIRASYLRVVNADIRVSFLYVRRYRSQWKRGLSYDVFEQLREARAQTDKITKRSMNEQALELHSEKLGMRLLVWLTEEPNEATIGSDEPEIAGYKVTIDTGEPVRFGLNRIDDFQEFLAVADLLMESIHKQCFTAQESSGTFLICNLTTPPELLKVSQDTEHSASRSKASVRRDHLTVVCQEPKYLMAALKAYLRV